MINLIIRFIKRNPFLYNLAKKILNKQSPNTAKQTDEAEIILYAYILQSLDKLEAVKEEYKNLQKYNTKLLVLVDNKDCNIVIHKLIRENPEICFASFDYFKRHHAKMRCRNIVWLNYTEAQSGLLDYLA